MRIFARWLLLLALAFDLAGSPFHAHSHDVGLHHVGVHQHASQAEGPGGVDLDDDDEAFGHSLAAIRCVVEATVEAADSAQASIPQAARPLTVQVAPEAAFAGCSHLYEGKYDFREGWREAEIIRIEQVSGIEGPDFYQCIRAVPKHSRAEQLFAVVAYKNMGRRKTRAVPITTRDQWAVGEKAYIDLTRCDGSMVHRRVEANLVSG